MRLDVLAVLLVVATITLLVTGYRRLRLGTAEATAAGALQLSVAVIIGFAAVLSVAALPVW